MSAIDISRLFSVEGLVVVITGGGSGLGAMMAKALALNGASKVYIIGRRKEKLDEVAKTSPHGNIIPLAGDVTSKDSLSSLAAHVERETGHIDLLIANSGIIGPTLSDLGPNPTLEQFQSFAWNQSADDFNSTYALNCTSVYYTALAFLLLLDAGNKRRADRPGAPSSQIIITSSIAGYLRVIVTGFAYVSSKAGATHLCKALSSYLAPYGIRCNAFAPGFFPSEMTEDFLQKSGNKAEAAMEGASPVWELPRKNVPEGRAGTEEDMAGTVLWLASRAGGYINGNVVVIDGGRIGVVPATY